MIEKLLPAAVVVNEAVPGAPIDALLAPERAVIAASVPARREEFTVGRSCARRALQTLGQPSCAILPGLHREPMWPGGFVGSITHCSGYCAAAVARVDEIVTVGIDAELDEPLPRGVLVQVAAPTELEWLRARHDGGICWDRLLFSAKESVFKAWFPLAQRWLGFEDARIAFAPDAGTFEAQLLVEGPLVGGVVLRSFTGRYLVRDGLVLTAIAVAAASRVRRRVATPSKSARFGPVGVRPAAGDHRSSGFRTAPSSRPQTKHCVRATRGRWAPSHFRPGRSDCGEQSVDGS